MATLPTPLRAALGLAVTALEEARKLPETLPQAPVVAVSTAMQVSLRVQQRIAELAARGDEVLSQLRGSSSEPPAWATFDETPDPEPHNGSGRGLAAFDRVPDGSAGDPGFEATEIVEQPVAEPVTKPAKTKPTLVSAAETIAPVKASPTRAAKAKAAKAKAAPPTRTKAAGAKAAKAPTKAAKTPTKAAKTPTKAAKTPTKAAKRAPIASEPLVEAAHRAQPSQAPNPTTMAAEIVQAHQAQPDAE